MRVVYPPLGCIHIMKLEENVDRTFYCICHDQMSGERLQDHLSFFCQDKNENRTLLQISVSDVRSVIGLIWKVQFLKYV